MHFSCHWSIGSIRSYLVSRALALWSYLAIMLRLHWLYTYTSKLFNTTGAPALSDPALQSCWRIGFTKSYLAILLEISLPSEPTLRSCWIRGSIWSYLAILLQHWLSETIPWSYLATLFEHWLYKILPCDTAWALALLSPSLLILLLVALEYSTLESCLRTYLWILIETEQDKTLPWDTLCNSVLFDSTLWPAETMALNYIVYETWDLKPWLNKIVT
jgi:hypothetical protein